MLITFRGFVVSPVSSVIMTYPKLADCGLVIVTSEYCLVGRLMETKTMGLLLFFSTRGCDYCYLIGSQKKRKT